MRAERGFLGGFLILAFAVFIAGFLTGILSIAVLNFSLDAATLGFVYFVVGMLTGLIILVVVMTAWRIRKQEPFWFAGEKSRLFWFGLVLATAAFVVLFSVVWLTQYSSAPFGIDYNKVLVPTAVGALVFCLTGLYMMKSGVKRLNKT
jgi:hypothetical protein